MRFTNEEALAVTSFAAGDNTPRITAATLAKIDRDLMSQRPALPEPRS
jgi:hypothetical protein